MVFIVVYVLPETRRHLSSPNEGRNDGGKKSYLWAANVKSTKIAGNPQPYNEYQIKRFLSFCFCETVNRLLGEL